MPAEPSFTIGIEEEYLLVDRETLDLAQAPEGLIADCAAEFEGQVSPEFLQCQVEIGTKICRNVREARDDLKRLRACVSRVAQGYGLTPLAVSCHPFADWHKQHHTNKDRYNLLERALGGVARRMLISGMHVHVAIEDKETRIDLLNQFSYFLPHLLALSTSSPYWAGDDTGLNSYRLTVFDNLPRTGLPPEFNSYAEYERSVQTIINTGAIEDSTKIWWDIRPSGKFPTLESRICDVSPRLEDAVSLAALTQAIMRMLWRLRTSNQRWRIYDRFLIGENRWRAQRYGMSEGLIDFGAQTVKPFSALFEELLELIEEDAKALGSLDEIKQLRRVIEHGTSAERQRRIYVGTRNAGGDHQSALRAVVDGLISEFTEGL